MRTFTLLCAAVLAASSAFSAPTKEEVKRLAEAGAVLDELRATPEKGIPEDLWNKAQCVIVIPSIKKGAFVVGGEYGKGVMSCRSARDWSAPVFMQIAKGSWGLQIGGEQIDLVMLVMNRRGLDKLLQDKVSLGGDASIAAGPVGRAGSAATDAQLHAEMLSYSRTQGVFAGIDLSGGVLRPDKDANTNTYGPDVDPKSVVTGEHRVAEADAAGPFMRALRQETRATTGRIK
jgi:lipid-binding SYLF domain-containing protein